MTMSDNPYRIPDDDRFYMIHTSGGRTSAYMLAHVLATHGGRLPRNAVAAFANTGKEYPQTLDFLHAIETRWPVAIVWLEYRHYPARAGGRDDPKHDVAIVNHTTASRHGEPFAAMIRAKQYLPNATQRICTSELKINVADWYSRRVLGWPKKKVRHLLGMRYDEPKRVKTALFGMCDTDYPLYHARVTKRDVNAWWERRGFQLDLPEHKGNCDGCFLKGSAKLRRIFREEPERADWWIEQERFRDESAHGTLENPWMAQFSKRWSYSELKAEAVSGTGQYALQFEGEEHDMPCFCGA